jgi:hypothetical protein
MQKRYIALMLMFLMILTGCNGSSGENESVEGQVAIATSINLEVQDATNTHQQSFDKYETITLIATVYDQSSTPLSGELINFSANVGNLSVSSKLTDANGQAIITISNDTLAIGAGVITANLDTLSSSQNYEYLDNESISINPSLSTSMLLGGSPANQFKADQQVQISTTVLDANGAAINDEIVFFTADIGSLSAASALTINGKAHVTLIGTDENIGAGVVTASFTQGGITITNLVNYQVVSADSLINDEVRLGYFDESDTFIEGKIKLSLDSNSETIISAGGTLGLSVDLVDNNDERITPPTPVTFTSNCVQNGNAVIDATVFSIKGNAKATFEDVDCAGVSGTDDVLIASVTANGVTNTASEVIVISGEQLGSIEFISAAPTSIVLKGTGGQNKQETATLTFRVKSELGNVLAQQQVDFSLNTSVGGMTLSRESGFTNSQGLITTQVIAGSVPTAVRVTAKATMEVNNEPINVQTQSDLLSINTGLPEQRSLTIAATILNPESDLNGETSVISAWLADNFNNPVPDGTTVNFTTEGGVIEPTCSTINGHCSVTWTSAEPRLPDNRATILITAIGHESFFDTNGNNTFDEADGDAIIDNEVDSGAARRYAESSGFIDMSEAWRDDNENNNYDDGEIFLDYDESESFSAADGDFNGPQCQGDKCATAQAIHVRKSLVLIMSSSTPSYILALADDENNSPINTPSIDNGESLRLRLIFADKKIQILPFNTTVAVSLSAGELTGTLNRTVINDNPETGYDNITFEVTNPLDVDTEIATLTFTFTTPSGTIKIITEDIRFL